MFPSLKVIFLRTHVPIFLSKPSSFPQSLHLLYKSRHTSSSSEIFSIPSTLPYIMQNSQRHQTYEHLTDLSLLRTSHRKSVKSGLFKKAQLLPIKLDGDIIHKRNEPSLKLQGLDENMFKARI